ncbi:SDR family oxidoreductase [Roseibium marinum]|uniref:Short-subunit dehydrogenase n=1 Tax=Roseibium marinum TaxID=281252 RepID=A0A2S3UVM9_9HYPH|nr:SDR family oxidoreductase [Roseibium marinum]POF31782.1 short-subunit dehydrogenase [Roseibium marinum]
MKTVLITGCSSGFGEAMVHRFADGGWNVVATMRNPARKPEFPGGVHVVKLDVQDRKSIGAAVAEGIERFDAIDAVVNNAGFGLHGPFEATPREKVLEQFEVNVFGLMDVVRALLPHFRARRSGVILNVTSGAGVFGLPFISLYAASKFAVEGFSESLHHEVAPFGIAVKLIEPGGVTSTGFMRRGAEEATAFSGIEDYQPVIASAQKVFGKIASGRSGGTSEEVADVTFNAATDGTDRLRYIATDGIRPWVEARRETSEEDYMALMRSQVGLGKVDSAVSGSQGG